MLTEYLIGSDFQQYLYTGRAVACRNRFANLDL
jgi:hypothetical protein